MFPFSCILGKGLALWHFSLVLDTSFSCIHIFCIWSIVLRQMLLLSLLWSQPVEEQGAVPRAFPRRFERFLCAALKEFFRAVPSKCHGFPHVGLKVFWDGEFRPHWKPNQEILDLGKLEMDFVWSCRKSCRAVWYFAVILVCPLVVENQHVADRVSFWPFCLFFTYLRF